MRDVTARFEEIRALRRQLKEASRPPGSRRYGRSGGN
jgi:hypothetical protein